MTGRKRPLGRNVLVEAQSRISVLFDDFENICVSFSGGKDSTVLLHLAADEARRRKRRFTVLFIDWEAQYKLTIEHIKALLKGYKDCIVPLWVALPLTTVNAVSAIEPEWTCWDSIKRDLWVRQPPVEAITSPDFFPFYKKRMTFEEFVAEFPMWLGGGKQAACLVGIRAGESLNRFRTLIETAKTTWKGQQWTTLVGGAAYNAYPIYDWRTEDIWTYLGKFGKTYNKIYDRMHQAGLTLSQMRICEPYGDEQRRGLWLFHILEPETWSKVVARVAGANSGALYATEAGNIMGNRSISLPQGHTWKSFALFLLDTMPPKTSEHYKNKIAVYLKWYADRGQLDLPDTHTEDLGAKDVGSWRRVCKCLLKNDYWAKTLSFGPTKTSAYTRYVELMKKRRKEWAIFSS